MMDRINTTTVAERVEQQQRSAAETKQALRTTLGHGDDERNTVLVNRVPDAVLAFGHTIVLAPAFSLRLKMEDSLLMNAFARTDGLACWVESELQVPSRYSERAVLSLMSDDAARVWRDDNAGGASSLSEAMSVEVLHRAFGAKLVKTELELAYWPVGAQMTDFSVMLGERVLGVSVSRAFAYAAVVGGAELSVALSVERAEALLRKKLGGILASTAAVTNEEWTKQVLHLWLRHRRDVAVLRAAYEHIEPALAANTVVLVTLCRGLPGIFTEKAAAPKATRRPLKGLKDAQHQRVLLESDPVLAAAARGSVLSVGAPPPQYCL